MSAICVASVLASGAASSDPGWLVNLAYNTASFATIIAPAWLVVRYFRLHPEKLQGNGIIIAVVRQCVTGEPVVGSDGSVVPDGNVLSPTPKSAPPPAREIPEPTFIVKACTFVFCVVGLQGSYLIWGVLQEQARKGQLVLVVLNAMCLGQFLVLTNRLLALVAAVVIIKGTAQPNVSVPLVKYSFSSMSNVMSSWCQYEALKYVGFPTQVLAKACKILPVMIMGKFVEGKSYPLVEYVLATTMSVGVALFMFARAGGADDVRDVDSASTSVAGVVLLAGYLAFDSFTSNHQSYLFKEHKMSSYQMMFGINLFSCLFTVWALVQQGALMSCVAFSLEYPAFMWHSFVLALTSATGQIFIFRTLSMYGTLVFAIVMTTRQVISIFLSAIVFGHNFPAQAWVGIAITFVAMFAKIYYEVKGKHDGKGKVSGSVSSVATGNTPLVPSKK